MSEFVTNDVHATDAKNQTTLYQYLKDNNLKKITYNSSVTPDVSFTYETNYNRISTMVDGIGTNVYSYNPVTNPLGSGRLGKAFAKAAP